MTGHDLNDPRLAFLVFRSRSGSTFFGDRLSRHPEVLVTPESNLAPKLKKFLGTREAEQVTAAELANYVFQEPKFRQWGLPGKNLAQALETCDSLDWPAVFKTICRAYRDHQKPGAGIVVFKNSGWYYKNIDLLLSLFPGSSALGVVRDPRAVFNSARKALHSEKTRPMAENALSNAMRWKKYIKILKQAAIRHPGRVNLIRYESILEDFAGSLNLSWNTLGVSELKKEQLDEILDQKEGSHLVSENVHHLHENVLKEPMPELAQKWRSELPRRQALIIRLICARQMRELGYL